MKRSNQRESNQLRPVHIALDFTKHAEGSVLITCGDTQVICTASVDESTPKWLKKGGWISAEYGMLPRSTNNRMHREAQSGSSSRSLEISRLIGRSLRAAVDLRLIGSRQITVDCDVIQADGGTRTASITGGFVALAIAIHRLIKAGTLAKSPIIHPIAAVSVGIFQDTPILDLDYAEDSQAQTDMNVIMNNCGGFIEIQGTAEKTLFNQTDLSAMLDLAQKGINQLISIQTISLQSAGYEL